MRGGVLSAACADAGWQTWRTHPAPPLHVQLLRLLGQELVGVREELACTLLVVLPAGHAGCEVVLAVMSACPWVMA